jgi:hypothetical protein
VDRGHQRAGVVEHGDALRAHAAALLRVVAAGAAVLLGVVGGVDRRHPDDLPAELERRLDRGGVEPADVRVQDDPAEHEHLGDEALDEVRARDAVLRVALEHDRPHPHVARRLHELEVVDEPREEVGPGVLVQVDRTAHVDQLTAVPLELPRHRAPIH